MSCCDPLRPLTSICFGGGNGVIFACFQKQAIPPPCHSKNLKSDMRPNGSVPTSCRMAAVCTCWCSRRSEEHTSDLQSLMRISYAVFCLKKKRQKHMHHVVSYNTIMLV